MTKTKFSARLFPMIIIVLLLLVFTGCANVDTQIDLDGEKFSGERLMTVSFDLDELLTRLPGGTDALNQQIDAVIPKQMTYTYEVKEDSAEYYFKLEFSSKQDYIDKVKNIISKAPEITFTYSTGVFTKGVTYNENFETRELFIWVDKLITENNLAAAAQGYSSQKFWNQTGVTIKIGNDEYHCDGGKVALQSGGSSVVTGIAISTDIMESGEIERMMLVTVPKSVAKDQLTLIDSFFNDNTPDNGQWTKRTRSESYVYTIKFKAGNAAKLQSYMQKLTNAECSCSYDSVADLSQPLALSKLFNEKLDFSYYGGENAVHVTYQISSEQGTACEINLDNGETERNAETIDDGSYLSCTGDFNKIAFKTTVRQMASVKSLDYNLIQYSNNKFCREIIITLAEGTDPSVLDNMVDYYQVKGAGNTGIRADTTNDKPMVIITISGKPKQINAAEAVLFGGVGARSLSCDSDWGIYRPHPQITVVDSFDIASLLSAVNVEKYAYTYSKEGVVIRQITGTVDGEQAVEKPTNKDCRICVGLKNGIQTITVSAYYFNGWAIFFIILTVLLFIALVVMAVLLYLYKTGKIKLPENNKSAVPQDESAFRYQPLYSTPEPEPMPLPQPEPMPEVIPMPEPVDLPPRDLTASFIDEPMEDPPIMLPIDNDEPIPLKSPDPEPEPEPIPLAPITPVLSYVPDFEPVISYPQRYVPTEEFKSEPVVIPLPVPEPEPIPEPVPQPEVVQLPVVTTPPEPTVYSDYTDKDMIEDLNALGYLNEYKRRVQKVKVKVRKVKIEVDDE